MPEDKKEEKKRSGRPKGAKSLGIPRNDLKEVVEKAEILYQKADENIMSFSDIKDFLNLEKATATPLLGALSTEYGILEKVNGNWKLSELGKRVANNDPDAIRESFEKNSIFQDLSSRFWGKGVTPGVIVDHLRKKYKKGENVIQIAQRFLDAVNFINNLKGLGEITDFEKSETDITDITKWFKVVQLKYALNPPKVEIPKLADAIAEDFKDVDDTAIKTLTNSIKENKNNKEVLSILVNNLLNIATAEYPDVMINVAEITTKKDTKEKEQKTSEKEKIDVEEKLGE